MEFHIAADLKALWLALGLDSFVCPYCMATTRDEMSSIHIRNQPRVVGDALGVPSSNVHLCALHAILRIVERLLKCAALAAHSRDSTDNVYRVRALSKLLKRALHKNKFLIATTPKQGDSNCEYMSVDNVYDQVGAGMGTNVRAAVRTSRYIRLSAITGVQAKSILTQEIYREIVACTEDKCACSEMRAAMSYFPGDMQAAKCRYCLVLHVWEDFANIILPLLRRGVPERIQAARTNGTENIELRKIRLQAQKWLESYCNAYGVRVTPYLHIIGHHLHELLQQGHGSVGDWSQQGFEACHKFIRRIIHGGTSQGGGRSRSSALLQVMQHLFRRQWAQLRQRVESGSTTGPEAERIEQLLNSKFAAVDGRFSARYPLRTAQSYVAREVRHVFQRTPGLSDEVARTLGDQ
jgi:hypothetical protein